MAPPAPPLAPTHEYSLCSVNQWRSASLQILFSGFQRAGHSRVWAPPPRGQVDDQWERPSRVTTTIGQPGSQLGTSYQVPIHCTREKGNSEILESSNDVSHQLGTLDLADFCLCRNRLGWSENLAPVSCRTQIVFSLSKQIRLVRNIQFERDTICVTN